MLDIYQALFGGPYLELKEHGSNYPKETLDIGYYSTGGNFCREVVAGGKLKFRSRPGFIYRRKLKNTEDFVKSAKS